MSKLDEDTAKLVRVASDLDVPMFSERRGGNQSRIIQRLLGSIDPIYDPLLLCHVAPSHRPSLSILD